MKWLKHDSNAHTDAKMKKLRHKYGITGYGLYWYCVELIAGNVDASNITFELEEDAETIAIEWGLDQLKVQEIMKYMSDVGLFESDGGRITCLKLAKRLDDSNARNPEIKKILEGLKLIKDKQVGQSPTKSEEVIADEISLDEISLDDTKEKEPVEQSSTCVADVFEYWQTIMNHPRSKLDAKRTKLIKAALKLGYSVDDLKAAISGCSKTPHNMGRNDNGQRYDDISLILRDAGQIDRFIGNDEKAPTPQAQPQQLGRMDAIRARRDAGQLNVIKQNEVIGHE